MTFWQAMKFVHRESLAFLIACPLLALVPVLFELAQHVAEMRIGMYDGPAGARAAEANPLRMGLGYAKTLALLLPGYWTIRFLAGRRDAAAARSADSRSLALFAIVFALSALLSFLGLFMFPQNGPVGTGFFVFGLLFTPLLARFGAAAPLGLWISPRRSIRTMLPHALFAIPFSLVAVLPLMAVHYAFGVGAIFVPATGLKWLMLVIDSLVVGWLAALMAAVNYAVALRAGPLMPPPETA